MTEAPPRSAAPAATIAERRAPADPHPQVLESEPDLLVISYPQVPDDSKQDLADHQFVSPQTVVLQAPVT
jgi:hypothetical protein